MRRYFPKKLLKGLSIKELIHYRKTFKQDRLAALLRFKQEGEDELDRITRHLVALEKELEILETEARCLRESGNDQYIH